MSKKSGIYALALLVGAIFTLINQRKKQKEKEHINEVSKNLLCGKKTAKWLIETGKEKEMEPIDVTKIFSEEEMGYIEALKKVEQEKRKLLKMGYAPWEIKELKSTARNVILYG